MHREHLHYCAGCYVGHGQVVERACGRPAQLEAVQTTRDVRARGKLDLHCDEYCMLDHLKITDCTFYFWL